MRSVARRAAGTHQPSASPACPQADVGPVGFPRGAQPLLGAFPHLLFVLPAMLLLLPYTPQARVVQLGAPGESRTGWTMLKKYEECIFPKVLCLGSAWGESGI